MSASSPPPVYQGPAIDPSIDWAVRVHLTQIYQKLGNHYQGISLLQSKFAKLKSTTSTVTETISGGSGGGGGSTANFLGLGFINDQTGNTSYTTAAGDNGILLITSDASPVSINLSTTAAPYLIFITNNGPATTTLIPSSGLINGAASLDIYQGQWVLAECDGTNWKTTPINPVGTFAYRTITAPTTILPSDYQIEVTAGTFTQPLPTAVGIQGKSYSIKNSGTGIVTVSTTGGQTIDGQLTQPISQWTNIVVMSNGSNWIIL